MSTNPQKNGLSWALSELGLSANPERRGDSVELPAAQSGGNSGRLVDRSKLAIPPMHPSTARQDRVRVFEMVLRGHVLEAFGMAAELEEARLGTIRRRARRTAAEDAHGARQQAAHAAELDRRRARRNELRRQRREAQRAAEQGRREAA